MRGIGRCSVSWVNCLDLAALRCSSSIKLHTKGTNAQAQSRKVEPLIHANSTRRTGGEERVETTLTVAKEACGLDADYPVFVLPSLSNSGREFNWPRMSASKQQFGGDWTAEKLERVRKYLVAYATIMRKYGFRYAYLDAFAGTGYNTAKPKKEDDVSLFPELVEAEVAGLIDGSARIALKVEPRFTKYIFIEKKPKRFVELTKLKEEFPLLANDIVLINAEANAYLKDICENRNWSRNRAVLFLDPFGMQVTWDTMKAIAETEAIDLWLLFPLGVAVNRLLRRDARISQSWQRRLDEFFGTPTWREAFYHIRTEQSLFGMESKTEKVADFDAIANFFVARLKTIFAEVAQNPLTLLNSSNTPLYLLCFAAGNENGAKTAVKIAQDILEP